MDSAYAAPAARGINRRCHCLGGTTQLSNYDVSQHGNAVGMRATANSYAAQQHFEDGRAIKLRDARGAQFEPQTSYIDHYPVKELPVHTPQPAAPATGMPFTASTEYDNQYLPKSLTFNQIGTYGNPASMGNSNGHMQKLPTISSETTNQHFYPYWGVATPQKKGYAVRRISAAPALDFAGDTFTTTNAVEYQPKPSSYVRPTGVTVVQPLSEACDKHSTYNSFFQAKPTEGFLRVPRGLGPAPAPFTATTTYDNEFQEKPLPHELPHLSGIQAASALGLPGPRQSLAVQVEGNACSVLLPHSVCVPCSATQVFTTVRNGQTQVCISMLYGGSSLASNNRLLGQLDIVNIPWAAAGVPQIEVTFRLSADLQLTVVARDLDSGRQRVWEQGGGAVVRQGCC